MTKTDITYPKVCYSHLAGNVFFCGWAPISQFPPSGSICPSWTVSENQTAQSWLASSIKRWPHVVCAYPSSTVFKQNTSSSSLREIFPAQRLRGILISTVLTCCCHLLKLLFLESHRIFCQILELIVLDWLSLLGCLLPPLDLWEEMTVYERVNLYSELILQQY